MRNTVIGLWKDLIRCFERERDVRKDELLGAANSTGVAILIVEIAFTSF